GVVAPHSDLAVAEDLQPHPQQPDQVHAVLGVVAVLGLERGSLGVSLALPALILLPVLAGASVASLATKRVEHRGTQAQARARDPGELLVEGLLAPDLERRELAELDTRARQQGRAPELAEPLAEHVPLGAA